MENTCLPVAERSPDGVLTYGRGLLQAREGRRFVIHQRGLGGLASELIADRKLEFGNTYS